MPERIVPIQLASRPFIFYWIGWLWPFILSVSFVTWQVWLLNVEAKTSPWLFQRMARFASPLWCFEEVAALIYIIHMASLLSWNHRDQLCLFGKQSFACAAFAIVPCMLTLDHWGWLPRADHIVSQRILLVNSARNFARTWRMLLEHRTSCCRWMGGKNINTTNTRLYCTAFLSLKIEDCQWFVVSDIECDLDTLTFKLTLTLWHWHLTLACINIDSGPNKKTLNPKA